MTRDEEDRVRSEGLREGFLLALDRIKEDFQDIYEETPRPEIMALKNAVDKVIAERKRMIRENPNRTIQ